MILRARDNGAGGLLTRELTFYMCRHLIVWKQSPAVLVPTTRRRWFRIGDRDNPPDDVLGWAFLAARVLKHASRFPVQCPHSDSMGQRHSMDLNLCL